MTSNETKAWLMTGAGRGMRAAQKAHPLLAQLDADRALSTKLAHDDVPATA
jgi:hypothetical protein